MHSKLTKPLQKLGKGFDVTHFKSCLETKSLARSVVYLPVTTSTMDEADNLMKKGCASGTLVVADSQTQGKGRNNREWTSQSRQNLYFSLVLRPDSIQDVIKLNFAAPLAVAMAAKAEGADARIKWPNDVWVGTKKLAGILINTTATGSKGVAVNLGLGINVNQHMNEVKNLECNEATSVAEAVGRVIKRENFLADICSRLEALIALDQSGVMTLYKQFDLLLGQEILVMPKKREDVSSYYGATALDFTKEGYLLVRPDSDKDRVMKLSAEEVSIRPPK